MKHGPTIEEKHAALPRYRDGDEPWACLVGRALTEAQARAVRHTQPLCGPYGPHERAWIERAAAHLGNAHFLVTEAANTVSLYRTTLGLVTINGKEDAP
jgi:hypothetical protein